MHLYIIISIFLTLEYAYNADLLTHQYTGNNSDCLTDELYGDFTVEEYNNLVKRRKNVRKLLKNNLYRKQYSDCIDGKHSRSINTGKLIKFRSQNQASQC